ncbi:MULTISPECIES: hypothetical protein [Pseudoalteromonas]|uniref:Integral membrane protein n=1 Tax=Pseudoalteromonas piscicida TaxID=43662 RepID=A0ABM6NJE1_PSEO7|nr:MULTISPECIES: hypothetical protein [Pseudoalteromonas]ATD08786.1 hypothetical protein PPIS_a4112 [Pseudoalteromonas piscicida]MCO7199779.1 hypothetical protein [Pseudoalteromonas sp. OANN1]WPU30783.1 hypothetical protein SIO17_17090 [Pseudoalteromonas piscicida]
MRTSWIFLLICAAIAASLSVIYIHFNHYADTVMLACIIIFCFMAKNHENIKHIVALLLIMTAIEYGLVSYVVSLNSMGLPPFQGNLLMFGSHFLVDLTILMIMKYRVRLSLRYVRRTAPDNWRSIYMTHADPILYGIYFAFILVDLAAFGENIIRNLEHFGVDESFAKQFWSWGLIYYNYEILKSILLSCVVTTILATIFVERQRPDTPDEELESEPK